MCMKGMWYRERKVGLLERNMMNGHEVCKGWKGGNDHEYKAPCT